jgi:hypothetical protein
MSVVLNWVKSNVYTVVFVAIMIVAPVALWIVSGRMNASVRSDLEARAAKISELDRLEKTKVDLAIPGPDNPRVDATIPVNRRFLERYQEVVDKISQDAEQIKDQVVQMNRKGRGVLLDELFPDPPSHLRETLPGQMYRRLLSAHEQLLKDCEAGAPPSVEDMVADLDAARERHMTQLFKQAANQLDEDEQIWLIEQLAKTRLSIYAERANDTKLYATLAELNMPDESERPERAEGHANTQMFDWQWQYWIKEDILKALYGANEPFDSVADAPVKRLVSLRVLDGPVPDASGSSAGSGRGGGSSSGFGPGGGGGRRGGGRQGGGGGGRPAVAADPSREVPLDYGVSFTGRTDNPLYDVRLVELVIVADSARIPEVFDALAGQNFMTVIAPVQVEALDLFAAIRDGYFYGAAPVSQLTLTLETIWLREWTAQFMPTELKQALGIPTKAAPTG